MASPTEPENYSISEMMDRLKERSSNSPSNGELVTRADGTQAIKVRSRKRRSHQPAKEDLRRSRKLRAIRLIGAAVLTLSLIATAAGIVVYMNGSGYRDKLRARVEEATGAKADVSKVRVTPIGADVSALALSWPDTSPIKELKLEGIAAELRISSFLGQPWTGEEVAAGKGAIRFGMPVTPGQGAETNHKDHFRFNRFRSSDFSMYFGQADRPAFSILNSSVSFYPRDANGRPAIRLKKGAVKFLPGFPEFNLDTALVGVIGRRLDIVDMRLIHPDGTSRGALTISGQVEPAAPGVVSTLDVEVEGLELSHLAGAEMGHILRGSIDTTDTTHSNFVSFNMSEPEKPRMVLSFMGGVRSQLILSQLAFLSNLKQIFADPAYDNLVLDSGSGGILRIEGTGSTLDDLDLNVRNRVSIRGSITVASDKTLSGRLRVGLPAVTVKSNAVLDATFGGVVDDVRWIDVNLSGTSAAPTDDFAKKVLSHTFGSAAPDGSPSPAATPKKQGSAGGEFERLTAPR
jgi:hypothetical protein